MPLSARQVVHEELEKWANDGVEGHFHGERPWYSFHEHCRAQAAQIVGALPSEVVIMNSLTVNLHLMMTTFYRPTAKRRKIIIDGPPFPSDRYAVQSQISLHGYDPRADLIVLEPKPGSYELTADDIDAALHEHGGETALVLFSGVSFWSGQFYPLSHIVRRAQEHGCRVGFDLAHAAGNVPLALHDWNADFAVWCNYKYLNSGPGAIAGCFIHERHVHDSALPRFAGWWGNDPATRFQFSPEFIPVASADAWQLSNPPIFSVAPVKASYDIFAEVGMDALRRKSERLTAYLEFLLDDLGSSKWKVITPRAAEQRGCQLSLLVERDPEPLLRSLQEQGAVVDFRRPNIIRVAPVPLYNSFEDIWQFAQILRAHA